MTLTHAIYLVRDIEQGTSFLSGLLGFEVTADETSWNGERFFTMADPGGSGLALQLIVADFQPEFAERKRASDIVDFILDTDDMMALLAKVELAGLRIHKAPTEVSYGITAIFEDPFGNLWDVVQRGQA